MKKTQFIQSICQPSLFSRVSQGKIVNYQQLEQFINLKFKTISTYIFLHPLRSFDKIVKFFTSRGYKAAKYKVSKYKYQPCIKFYRGISSIAFKLEVFPNCYQITKL